MRKGANESPTEGGFDWRQARWTPLYPPADVLAEMGRVTIAAVRADRQLALVLLAIKYSNNAEELLRKNSGDLYKILRSELQRLFEGRLLEWVEGRLLEWAIQNLEKVRSSIEARHAVAHSIWTVDNDSGRINVGLLAKIRDQEEVDKTSI